jgi:hypothetical protein
MAAVLMLAACTGAAVNYEKRGATPAQLDRDRSQCKKEAFRPSRFAIWASERYDAEALNRCMERKGYTVLPADSR